MAERMNLNLINSKISITRIIPTTFMRSNPIEKNYMTLEMARRILRMINKTNITKRNGVTNSQKRLLLRLNTVQKCSIRRKTIIKARIIKPQTQNNMLKMTSKAKTPLPNRLKHSHSLNPSNITRKRVIITTIIMGIILSRSNNKIISTLIMHQNHSRTIPPKDKDSTRKANNNNSNRIISNRIHLRRKIITRNNHRILKMIKPIMKREVLPVRIHGVERTNHRISNSNIK